MQTQDDWLEEDEEPDEDKSPIGLLFAALNLSDDTHIDQEVHGLFKRLGLKLKPRPLHTDFMYNGKTFNSNLPGRHLCHELAHWLIASENRRNLPEFGLGAGPESDWDVAEEVKIVSSHAAEEEEKLAALLGILIQHHLGLPVGGMFDEIYSLGFGEPFEFPSHDPFISLAWEDLVDMKLIDKNGFPRVLLDL